MAQDMLSQQFVHHNSNSIEISFCSHSYSDELIAINLCTWQDSCALVMCAKMWVDIRSRNRAMVKWIFPPKLCFCFVSEVMFLFLFCFRGKLRLASVWMVGTSWSLWWQQDCADCRGRKGAAGRWHLSAREMLYMQGRYPFDSILNRKLDPGENYITSSLSENMGVFL